MNNTTSLAWLLLYDEELEEIPDPNKPENVAYINAKRKEKKEAFKQLMEGSGKVLFREWKKRIKNNNLAMLFIPANQLCDCAACMIIRDIQGMFKLWLEAETIITEEEK